MVIDTSALFAILADEPERGLLNRRIEEDGVRLISAATALEASIVFGKRYGREGVDDFRLFLQVADFEIVPFSAEQWRIAESAYWKFGKGNHPAGLNYGDCFSYALSKHSAEPLLFKGDDFSKTDVESVSY